MGVRHSVHVPDLPGMLTAENSAQALQKAHSGISSKGLRLPATPSMRFNHNLWPQLELTKYAAAGKRREALIPASSALMGKGFRKSPPLQ